VVNGILAYVPVFLHITRADFAMSYLVPSTCT
jgi:hypothetical protein